MRRFAAIGWLCATLLASAPAHARELGRAENLVLSADRLFGFYLGQGSYEATGDTDTDRSFSGIGLGWNTTATPLMSPRFSIDYLLTDQLSAGGSVGSYSTEVESVDLTGFLLALRGGYILRLGHHWHFWPRVGLSFFSVEAFAPAQSSQFAIDIEALISFAPDDSWSLLLGPTFDLGLGGEYAGFDYTVYAFGITFGLAGWTDL